jgi:hypothetical protein
MIHRSDSGKQNRCRTHYWHKIRTRETSTLPTESRSSIYPPNSASFNFTKLRPLWCYLKYEMHIIYQIHFSVSFPGMITETLLGGKDCGVSFGENLDRD